MLEHLNENQFAAVKRIFPKRRGIIYRKMGQGKTRIALALNHLYRILNITVVVCRKKAFHTWKQELLKVGWKGYVAEFPKTKWYSSKRNTIWLVSHAMLNKVYQELLDYPISHIIFDELYLYSNPKSQLTKAARAFSEQLRSACVVGLSGTVMPAGDNLAIYSQASVIGIGHLLAKTTTAFRTKYQTFFTADFGRGKVRQFQNAPNADAKIRAALSKHTHFYFPTSDERSINEAFIDVDPSKQQLKLIQQLKDEYYTEFFGQEFELRSALELLHKVSAISNGNFGGVEFSTPKIEALQSKVEETLSEEKQVLIWCYYKKDVDILYKAFAGCPILRMSSEHKLDRSKIDDARIIIATVGTGSSINDFAQIPYAFYYSHSPKLLDLEQSRGRNDRADSRHKHCYYYHFFTRRTFDRHIYSMATTSGKIQSNFIELI